MNDKEEQPEAPCPDAYEVGYGKPPKQAQFKKGQSGNPNGRPKAAKMRKPVGTVVRRLLSEEVKVLVNGKKRKMTKLEAAVETLFAMVRKGNLGAIKLLINLGDKHIAPLNSLAELAGGRPLFTFTEEEAARFRTKTFTKGMLTKDMSIPDTYKDDEDGKPVL